MDNIFLTLLVGVVLILMALAFWLRKTLRSMRRDLFRVRDEVRSVKKLTAEKSAECVDAISLSRLQFHYPVFLGGPSIDATHARTLLFLLQERRPNIVVELGSGSSSVIIARSLELLKATPDVHIAVDHDERFLGLSKELARANQVEDFIQFKHCPLGKIDGFDTPWYTRVAELIDAGNKIEFLFVDGPPATRENLARLPALPVLRDLLAPNAVIVLDDSNRPGESEVVERWLAEFPEFSLTRRGDGKGVAVLQLQSLSRTP